jgi:hypothetical protein
LVFYSREVFATILTLSKYRLGYQWISAAICRGTYYFAWLISEGANIVIGLGYSGKKEVNGKTVYSWYVFTKYSNRFAIYGSEYPRQFTVEIDSGVNFLHSSLDLGGIFVTIS